VRWLGAGYLVYLGLRTILSREPAADAAAPPPVTLGRAYAQGALVNALNPKTALFFLAFLPQFVHPSRGPVAAQTVTLGLVFIVLAAASDCTYALLAGSLASRLRDHRAFARRRRYLTGGVYVALGVGAASAGHP
jgi:threonine/homoserine/homoserine lactone efflux protein